MIIDKKLLLLQLSQAETLVYNSKNYSFSDKNKYQYQEKLVLLFEKIKCSITENFDESKILDKKNHLDFIFKSLEFLKDSTLNAIPFEVVACLNKAMGDWIDPEKFIIVTSLQNQLYSFSYDLSFAKNELFYQSLQAEYGISFEKKLVQINLPIALAKDYLSAVALYHELGHFVDQQHEITSVAAYLLKSYLKSNSITDFLPFFPYLQNAQFDQQMIVYHLGEYFCDLFAAQYIDNCLNIFLDYIAGTNNYNLTHPSTINRSKVVNDFLNKINNPVVNLLQAVMQHITKSPLEILNQKIDSCDFHNLIPYDIKSDKELHGVIVYGWNTWLSNFDNFNDNMGYKVDLKSYQIYHVINNLIEKSIGNYFVINAWNQFINE